MEFELPPLDTKYQQLVTGRIDTLEAFLSTVDPVSQPTDQASFDDFLAIMDLYQIKPENG